MRSRQHSSANNPSSRSSTVSLRESVFRFVEENGRRYHSFNEGSKSTEVYCSLFMGDDCN
jgi:hypothetical protein